MPSTRAPSRSCAALAVDTTMVRQCLIQLDELVTMPLQFIIVFVVLFHYAGNATWFALVGFFASLPLEFVGFVGLGNAFKELMALRDQRMRRVIEMCQAIKAIKAATLERFVHQRIAAIRVTELKQVRTKNIFLGFVILGFSLKFGLMIVRSVAPSLLPLLSRLAFALERAHDLTSWSTLTP
jgi:ABC-type multidrug transport system fused ATPase/permease subunit